MNRPLSSFQMRDPWALRETAPLALRETGRSPRVIAGSESDRMIAPVEATLAGARAERHLG